MSPADAIALPFIERDFETPSYDRKLELDRIRSREYKQKRRKGKDKDVPTKKEEDYEKTDRLFRRRCNAPAALHPRARRKKDDLLQRLGKCEDAIQRITDAVRGGHNDVRTVAIVKDALFTLDQQITKERMQK